MGRTSYALNAEHMVYLVLIFLMVGIVMIGLVIAAVSPNPEFVLFLLLLVIILAGIVISIGLYKKWSNKK